MNTKNSETIEPHKFILSLTQRLGLRNSNKHAALQNSAIITMQYCNSSKLKITAAMLNDEF